MTTAKEADIFFREREKKGAVNPQSLSHKIPFYLKSLREERLSNLDAESGAKKGKKYLWSDRHFVLKKSIINKTNKDIIMGTPNKSQRKSNLSLQT